MFNLLISLYDVSLCICTYELCSVSNQTTLVTCSVWYQSTCGVMWKRCLFLVWFMIWTSVTAEEKQQGDSRAMVDLQHEAGKQNNIAMSCEADIAIQHFFLFPLPI